MIVVTLFDVEQTIQRSLTTAETQSLEQTIIEAEGLISGYVGVDYSLVADADIPACVSIVALRVVARAIEAGVGSPGVQTQQSTTGPFSKSVTYTPEARSGSSVYLTRTDKVILRPVKPTIYSVQLKSGRSR